MGALPTIKKFLTEDYPSQSSWIPNLLYSLNLMLSTLFSNLNNGITFGQNMLGQINTLTISGASPTSTFQYKFGSQGNPAGVWMGSVTPTPTSAVSVSWTYSAGTVTVNIQGLPKTGSYNITFITLGA